ncbi:MAG: FtsX-like permease family protein, partial [Bacteroidetes bacterium]|nr:FtsX-like permease family protein [Bacteroidota bacterium]
PRVLSLSASSYLPAGPSDNNNFFIYPDDQSSKFIKTLRYEVDENYLGTLGMKLASGRNFSDSYGADSSAAILNEAAVKAMGWTRSPLGHTLSRVDGGTVQTWHVVGVVKDFHFRSLHEAIGPVVLVLGKDYGTTIVKIRTKDVAGILASMRRKWNGLKAEIPFSYSFLDDRFNNTYKTEQNTGSLLGIFAGLTIFVACLGLFGLATFMAEQRTREIGIRKVLGADVTGLLLLLSTDFIKLVGLAFLLAAPVAWLVMNKWLQDFAYRITISWEVFLYTAVITLIITILTISLRAIRAATANPVKSLRSE